jgi:hypothetical protein
LARSCPRGGSKIQPGLSDLRHQGYQLGTYDITGTADGFVTDNPSFRADGTFAIKVSC